MHDLSQARQRRLLDSEVISGWSIVYNFMSKHFKLSDAANLQASCLPILPQTGTFHISWHNDIIISTWHGNTSAQINIVSVYMQLYFFHVEIVVGYVWLLCRVPIHMIYSTQRKLAPFLLSTIETVNRVII